MENEEIESKFTFSEGQRMILARLSRLCSMDNERFFTVTFLFWFLWYIEKSLEGLVLKLTQKKLKHKDDELPQLIKDFLGDCLNEMTFNNKIKLFEKVMLQWFVGTKKDLNKLLEVLSQYSSVRNAIAHNNPSRLKYRGEDLNDSKTQLRMLEDFDNALTPIAVGLAKA